MTPSSVSSVPIATRLSSMRQVALDGSEHCTLTTSVPAPRTSSSIEPCRIHATAVDDRHRVAGALDFVQQVRREHHRPALVDQAFDHRPHLVHTCRIEPVHRFVQDQQLGIPEQARCDPEALAHAHRVGGDLVIGPIRQADPRQRRCDPVLRLPSTCCSEKTEILTPGEMTVEPGFVHDRADPRQCIAAFSRHRTPLSDIVPLSALVRPRRVRINVVLPAPFGPR